MTSTSDTDERLTGEVALASAGQARRWVRQANSRGLDAKEMSLCAGQLFSLSCRSLQLT
jgi:hypothetical protein